VDATPLLGHPTGVARYVQGLITGLQILDNPPEIVLTAFSMRGDRPHIPRDGSRVRWARRGLPARLLQSAWTLAPTPPVELLSGPVDVFHATNFVLPPRRRAGGVVTVHDLTYLRYPETVTRRTLPYRTLVPASVSSADVVITVSHAVADELVAEYDLPPGKVAVAPNGVDEGWFLAASPGADLRDRLALPNRYFVFVGSLEPRKNLGVLVRAHQQAFHNDPALPKLVLAGPAGWGDPWGGGGPPADGVCRTGFLDESDLRSVVAGSEALCLPSLYEGFGLPILEALATGRRVIVSDIPAHRETAGTFATYVGVNDVDGWSAALVAGTGMSNEEQAARRDWARGFTWERSAQVHVEAYRRATR
jgi:glycosyltransferase involved in cell wall biosynthesis